MKYIKFYSWCLIALIVSIFIIKTEIIDVNANTNQSIKISALLYKDIVGEVGETSFLIADTTPENAEVIWKSSNEKVATIDQDGAITGVSVGKVDITGTIKGTNVSDTLPYYIQEAVDFDISVGFPYGAVRRWSQEIYGEYGKQTYYSTVPNVKWTSDDENIARIEVLTGSSCDVIALNPGITTITASEIGTNKSSSVEVTTNDLILNHNTIFLYRPKSNIEIGERIRLEAFTNPVNSKVSWNSHDEKIAKVDQNGNVIGVGVGSTEITAKTSYSEKTITINVRESYRFIVDNVQVDINMPIITGQNEVKFLEHRELFRALNLDVYWNDSERTAYGGTENNMVYFRSGDNKLKINNEYISLNYVEIPFVEKVNYNLYVPIRRVVESLGYDITINENTKTIIVNTNDYKLIIDDVKVDVEYSIIDKDGVQFMFFRDLFSKLNVGAYWDAATGLASGGTSETMVYFRARYNEYMINDESIRLNYNEVPFVDPDSEGLYIPVKVAAEAFGYRVTVDDVRKIIDIETNPKEYKLIVDNKEMDAEYSIIDKDGVQFMFFRDLFSKLNVGAYWDAATGLASGGTSETMVYFRARYNEYGINDESIRLNYNEVPFIDPDSEGLYIPVKRAAEAIWFDVTINERSKTIVIESKPKNYKLIVDNKEPVMPALSIINNDGVKFMAFRDLFFALNVSTVWHHDTQTVDGWNDSTKVQLSIGKDKYIVNDRYLNLKDNEIPFLAPSGHAYIPIKKTVESLGYSIRIDELSKSIIVENRPNTITIVVEEKGKPVEGASVIVGNEEKITNSNGEVTFIVEVNITINYYVSKANFGTRYGSVKPSGSPAKVSAELPQFVLGDVSGDGKISVADVSMTYNNYRNITTVSEHTKKSMDVNKDGKVTISDVSLLYTNYKNGSPGFGN